jgi:hypothetical protein
MYNECRHILTSGHKCKAAALRGQAFCYYHTAARRFATTYTSPADPLLLPSTEDTAGVQLALNQVLRSLASNRIDRRQAGVYFYGLQLAARLAQKSKTGSSKTVRETDEDSEGYILAPRSPSANLPPTASNAAAATSARNLNSTKTNSRNWKTASGRNNKANNKPPNKKLKNKRKKNRNGGWPRSRSGGWPTLHISATLGAPS